MHALIDHFQQFLPPDDDELALLDGRVSARKIKRKQMILQEGFVYKQYAKVFGDLHKYGVLSKTVAAEEVKI